MYQEQLGYASLALSQEHVRVLYHFGAFLGQEQGHVVIYNNCVMEMKGDTKCDSGATSM